MTMTAIDQTQLEEILDAPMQSVYEADAAYEAAIGSPDEAAARARYRDAKAAYRAAESAAFAEGWHWTCGRCGGSGTYLHYGTCFNCGGSGFHPSQTKHRFETDPATRAKRAAKAAAERAAQDAAYETSLSALPGPVADALRAATAKFDRIGGYYNDVDPTDALDREEEFRYNLAAKLRQYGALSQKQVEAVERGLERDAKKAAEAEALKSAPLLPEGTYAIEGEVLSTKSQPGYAGGTTYKMLVKLDDGNKVWGTVPAAIDSVQIQPGATRALDRGDRVAFTATVERSDDDVHFGFYKRPKGARIVKAAD